jgi:hypothetical protein
MAVKTGYEIVITWPALIPWCNHIVDIACGVGARRKNRMIKRISRTEL